MKNDLNEPGRETLRSVCIYIYMYMCINMAPSLPPSPSLSMRFPDTFVSADEAMALQEEIEEVIGYSLTYKVRRRSSKTTLREQLEEAVQTGDESLTDVGDALIGQLLQTERSLAAEDASWSRKRKVGGSSQRRSSSGDTERSSKRTHQRNEN